MDLHFSFYYDLVCKADRKIILSEYYKQLADEYVSFISTLSANGVKCFVLAIYPSAVESFRIPSQLIMYGVLTVDQILQVDKETWWEATNFKSRSARLQLFNDSLRASCERSEGRVTFLSINDKLLSPEDNTVRKEFVDLSPYNVHLLWEPLIALWAEELEKWDMGLNPSLLTDTKLSGKLYGSKKAKEIEDNHYGSFDVGPRLKDLFYFLLEKSLELEPTKATALSAEMKGFPSELATIAESNNNVRESLENDTNTKDGSYLSNKSSTQDVRSISKSSFPNKNPPSRPPPSSISFDVRSTRSSLSSSSPPYYPREDSNTQSGYSQNPQKSRRDYRRKDFYRDSNSSDSYSGIQSTQQGARTTMAQSDSSISWRSRAKADQSSEAQF